MRTVSLEDAEWQAVVQLIVNAVIQGTPALSKLLVQVQAPPPLRGNGRDEEAGLPAVGSGVAPGQRSPSEQRGTERGQD